MPHAHTARVIDEWRRLRGRGGRLPERTALSPLLFGGLLPQMFVAALDPQGWRLRTAGALLDDLHGRALAGSLLLDLWDPADRPAVRRALDAAVRRGEPWTAACRGETARGRTAVLELTLAPATGPHGDADRCVGLLQPLSPLSCLAGEALTALRLTPPHADGPRLVVDNTRARPLG